jgi:hypothetical protein
LFAVLSFGGTHIQVLDNNEPEEEGPVCDFDDSTDGIIILLFNKFNDSSFIILIAGTNTFLFLEEVIRRDLNSIKLTLYCLKSEIKKRLLRFIFAFILFEILKYSYQNRIEQRNVRDSSNIKYLRGGGNK